MKKLLLAAIVFVAVAALVGPKLISTHYQQQLTQVIEHVQKSPGYQVTLKQSEAHWFSHDAEYQVTLDLNQLLQEGQLPFPLPLLATTIQVHTGFGPLLPAGGSLLGWYQSKITVKGDELRDQLFWDSQSPLYQLTLQASLLNNIHYQDKIPELSFRNEEEGITIILSPFEGIGHWFGTELSYQGHSEQLLLQGAQVLTFKGLDFSLNADVDLATLLAGRFYDSVIEFALGSVDIPKVKIEQAKFELTTKDNQADGVTVGMRYQLGQLQLPTLQLSDGNLAMELTHLNKEVLERYQAFQQATLQTKSSPDEVAAKTLAFFEQHLQALLALQPQFNITDLRFRMPTGQFQGQLQSKLVDFPATVTLPELQLPQFWLQHLQLNSRMDADSDLLKTLLTLTLQQQLGSAAVSQMSAADLQQLLDNQVNATLQSLTNSGMLQLQDNRYSSVISLEKGKLQVNQHDIPLPL